MELTEIDAQLERKRKLISFLLISGSLVVGSAVCMGLILTKPKPPQRNPFARYREVTVTTIVPVLEQTPIKGHGTVRAKNQVDIIPLVSGKLTQTHPDLAQGKIIHKGDLLFEIDRTIYESRIIQVNAEVAVLEATLSRHDQEATNLLNRIENVELMLDIDKKDYLTSKDLYEVENVGTQRDVDMVYQKYLLQKGVMVELHSKLSMIPHLKRETQAKLEASWAKLRQAEFDLENTRILCPFDARVESVHAFRSQVVTAHFSIAKLTDMEAFEISVGVDPSDLQWLNEAVRPGALNEGEDPSAPTVKVRWTLQGQEVFWEGRVTRFERVDEVTRTARLVVEIRHLDMVARTSSPHANPPLSIGMFCSMEIPAKPLNNALIVPRHAIYDNQWVYVFEPGENPGSGRLARRIVPILRSLHDSVLVDYSGRQGDKICELKAGEQVIVSPLIKPVVGMQLRLRERDTITLHRASTNQWVTVLSVGLLSTPSSTWVPRGVDLLRKGS